MLSSDICQGNSWLSLITSHIFILSQNWHLQLRDITTEVDWNKQQELWDKLLQK